MKRFILILALLAAPAHADEATPQVEERNALFTVLTTTDDAQIADAAQRAIWESWMEAPDDDAQALLDLGLQRMRIADNAGAVEVFGELVAYAPDFAEGWNQRAFAHFRIGDYEKSLEDIDAALALEPRHFGALSGKFRILMVQGRGAMAQQTLRAAVEANPWLVERALLAPESE